MTMSKRSSIITLLAVLLVGGGIAAAAWLVSGTGPAEARATTAVSLTVAAGTPTATLYPGATSALYATVTNPNPFPVQLTGATFGAVTATPLSGKTCASTNVTVSGPATFGTPISLAANNTVAVTIPSGLTMSTTAVDGCQGATFSVQVTLNGASA